MVHEKNWRVSLCVQELYHPQGYLRILADILVCRNHGLCFYLVLDFWLARQQVSPVPSFQHVYLTQIRDRNLSHTGLSVLV